MNVHQAEKTLFAGRDEKLLLKQKLKILRKKGQNAKNMRNNIKSPSPEMLDFSRKELKKKITEIVAEILKLELKKDTAVQVISTIIFTSGIYKTDIQEDDE